MKFNVQKLQPNVKVAVLKTIWGFLNWSLSVKFELVAHNFNKEKTGHHVFISHDDIAIQLVQSKPPSWKEARKKQPKNQQQNEY